MSGPMDVSDGATVCNVGRAFGLACKKLNDAGQPDVVHEVNDQKESSRPPAEVNVM